MIGERRDTVAADLMTLQAVLVPAALVRPTEDDVPLTGHPRGLRCGHTGS